MLTKLIQILVPLLTASILYIIIYDIVSNRIYTISDFLDGLDKGYFVFPISWFVLKIVLMYILFGICSRLRYCYPLTVVGVLFLIGGGKLVGLDSAYYVSDIAFVAGIFYQLYSNSIKMGKYATKLALLLFVFLFLYNPPHTMYVLMFLLPRFACRSLCYFPNKNIKCFSVFQKISYETYLCQAAVGCLVLSFVDNGLYSFLIITILTYIVAYTAKYINTLIIEKLITWQK